MTAEDIKIIKDDAKEFIVEIRGLSKETRNALRLMLPMAKVIDDAVKTQDPEC